MRMPLSKLFGISASGFNSGEDDIEVYNAMVESQVRNKLKYPIVRMVEIRCQQKFGYVPDDLKIEFKPLRVLSAEQEETCKTQVFNRAAQARTMGEIDSKTFHEICNKENLLGGVMVDTEDMDLDDAPAGAEDGYEDDEVDGDGGNGDVNANDPGSESITVNIKKSGGGKNSAKNPPQAKAAMVNDDGFGIDRALTTLTHINVKPWTTKQKFYRLMQKNSSSFDRASFEADGGVAQMQMAKRGYFFDREKAKDGALWDRSVAAARAAGYTGAEESKAFAVWFYSKHGGGF